MYLRQLLRIYSFRPIWPCPIVAVLATLAKFLKRSAYCTLINCVFTFRTRSAFFFGCFNDIMTHFKLVKEKFPEFDYVARSPVQISNHIPSEAIYNVTTHHLLRYYQPQRVPFTAWTALVTWGTRGKQARTRKILQNI